MCSPHHWLYPPFPTDGAYKGKCKLCGAEKEVLAIYDDKQYWSKQSIHRDTAEDSLIGGIVRDWRKYKRPVGRPRKETGNE